jgi:hypothetical protein
VNFTSVCPAPLDWRLLLLILLAAGIPGVLLVRSGARLLAASKRTQLLPVTPAATAPTVATPGLPSPDCAPRRGCAIATDDPAKRVRGHLISHILLPA